MNERMFSNSAIRIRTCIVGTRLERQYAKERINYYSRNINRNGDSCDDSVLEEWTKQLEYFDGYLLSADEQLEYWLSELIDETGDSTEYCDCCTESLPRATESTESILIRSTSEQICEDCHQEYVSCTQCGNEAHEDSDYVRFSEVAEDYFCEDCYYDTFSNCEDCGREDYNDDMSFSEDGYSYCVDCYREETRYPDWEVNDSIETLSCGVTQFDNKIGEMSPVSAIRPAITEIKRYEEPETFEILKSKRWIGLEIETHAYCGSMEDINYVASRAIRDSLTDEHRENLGTSSRYSGLWTEHDGSITGIDDDDIRSGEVVFMPRRGDYFARDSKLVVNALKTKLDAFVSSRCGLHIHIDARDFDWHHRMVLTTFVKLFEPHLFSWLPASRKLGSYSRSVSQAFGQFTSVTNRDEFIDFWYDTNRYSDDKLNSKRYHGLNQHSSFYYEGPRSIEIRYHQGTLNAEKIKHWAVLWTQIFDKSREIAENLFRTNTPQKLMEAFTDGLINHNTMSDFYSSVEIENEELFLENKRNRRVIKRRVEYFKRLVRHFDIPKRVHRRVWNMNLLKVYSECSNSNPIISIDNFFEVMQIPEDTQKFYSEMLKKRLSDAQTPESHYSQCFNRNRGVVEWNTEDSVFKIIDYELDRLQLRKKNPLERGNNTFWGAFLSYNHINYTLLKTLVDDRYDTLTHKITYGKMLSSYTDSTRMQSILRNSLFSHISMLRSRQRAFDISYHR